jgi:hypothetical protein
MATSPTELAALVSIPLEAAELILSPPPDIDEQVRRRRLEELVSFPK